MENKLEIKYRNQRQTFEILDNEINVDLNTSKHKLKYNIPLEDIKNTQFISKSKQDGFALVTYLSILLNLIFVIYITSESVKFTKNSLLSIFFSSSFAIVLVLRTLFEDFNEKHIDSSKLFYFIYTKKNAPEVDKFIELVYKKQVEFFRKKYFLIDPVLPYTIQYERYIWLYSNKYINENEYEVIKEDLDKYFNFNPII
ncbi:hypothetical protein [Flavobacterium restrictum]|uniref:Uncharacterized protein n=1 Tax=Flavobacterium restrictum TaxID=2594428 RepID=A0A553EDC1_9FLAO|nr:hypothetical protein [Flavobacterium restrictum]TRX42972.1 hypothetical protein FNW21_01160 [Flavobacterium restrictum]